MTVSHDKVLAIIQSSTLPRSIYLGAMLHNVGYTCTKSATYWMRFHALRSFLCCDLHNETSADFSACAKRAISRARTRGSGQGLTLYWVK